MMKIEHVSLLLIAVALCGCWATIPPAYQQAWEHNRQRDMYIHRPSQLMFPAQFAPKVHPLIRELTVFGGLRRRAIEHYDQTGNTISVRYEIPASLWGVGGHELTIFAYPVSSVSSPPANRFQAHWLQTIGSIVRAGPYTKIRLVSEDLVELNRDGAVIEGRQATFAFSKFVGLLQYEMLLDQFLVNGYYLQFKLPYEKVTKAEAVALLNQVLEEIAWPVKPQQTSESIHRTPFKFQQWV